MSRTVEETIELPAVPEKKARKKEQEKIIEVGDSLITDFLRNAGNGEKKAEAGIKLWFEKNIPGHETEDNSSVGAPDGYTPGWLLLELKGKSNAWLEGFFEGLARKELNFERLVIACENTLILFPGPKSEISGWTERTKKDWANLVKEAWSEQGAPNEIGKKLAKKHRSNKELIQECALFKWSPMAEEGSLFQKDVNQAIKDFKTLVLSFNPEEHRIEITPKNFSLILASFLEYFDESLDQKFELVHGFFRSLAFWNKKFRPAAADDPSERHRVYLGAGYFDGLKKNKREDFCNRIQQYEVLNPNKTQFYAYYDKAIDAVDPEYRDNNGIYFTNEYLARLAITLADEHLGSISDQYIVFDPACGSGNLVSSWNYHLDLRHKVVSEISPILLKAFELRFENQSTERKKGFTIIPKTTSGKGLNFVDQPASKYLESINSELKDHGHKLNKPLAIICNPPYRNQKNIKNKYYEYNVDKSIIDIVGGSGSKDLFVCFLAQIGEICKQAEVQDLPPNSVVLLFTQSGWLTRKKSYDKIRTYFLKNFQEKFGFVVDSAEFFSDVNSWPLVVSLWEYTPKIEKDPNRTVIFENYFGLERADLKMLAKDQNNGFDDLSHWDNDDLFRARLRKLLNAKSSGQIKFNFEVKKIKDHIPPQAGDGNRQISLDLIEKGEYMGGLCFATNGQTSDRRIKFDTDIKPVYENNLKATTKNEKKKIPSFEIPGSLTGDNVGFMESKQPFRTSRNFKNDGKTLFFLMDTRFHKMNTSQCMSGIPPKRGHVVSSLGDFEKNLIIAFAMAHSLAGKVPPQFNQFDMWLPTLNEAESKVLLQRAIAFVFTTNSCIECEIPKDHPSIGSPRVYVTNPLAPNKGTFWTTALKPLINDGVAQKVVESTTKLFDEWRKWINSNCGYKAKADLRIYDNENNRTPMDCWGIFQIEKELPFIKNCPDLHSAANNRKEAAKQIKSSIYDLLIASKYWDI